MEIVKYRGLMNQQPQVISQQTALQQQQGYQQAQLAQQNVYSNGLSQWNGGGAAAAQTEFFSVDRNKSPVSNKPKTKEQSMVTEVVQDANKFVRDHKSTIYWVAMLFLADHFLFNGVFKDKLQAIMSGLVSKVEAKLKDAQV